MSALLIAVLLAAAIAPGTPAAELRVLVIDDAGTAVAGAAVSLTGSDNGVHRRLVTDDNGRAAIGDLAAGTYLARAEKAGYRPGTFGERVAGGPVPIALAAGATFAAEIVLTRTGGISGRLVDDAGGPARGARILVQRADDDPAATIYVGRSGDDGTYQVSDLPPGEYRVSARGATLPRTFAPRRAPEIHLPVFFPGTTSAAAAARVPVQAAEVTRGIDVTLQRGRASQLEGLVIDAQGQPAPGAIVRLHGLDDNGGGPLTLRASTTGTFTVELVPGPYRLTTERGTMLDLVAGPGAALSVTVPLPRTSRIAGRVQIAGAPAPELPAGAAVLDLRRRTLPGEPASGVSVPLRDREALTIAADEVVPGEYFVQIAPGLDGWILESVAAGGRALLDGVLRVPAGEDLEDVAVTLSPATEIAGRVLDGAGAPVFRHRVLVFPPDRERWLAGSRGIAWAQPDTTGRFAVRDLPPGEYLLAVVDRRPTDPPDRALLEAAAGSAVRVTLSRGGRVDQDVRIAK